MSKTKNNVVAVSTDLVRNIYMYIISLTPGSNICCKFKAQQPEYKILKRHTDKANLLLKTKRISVQNIGIG